jgi:hypothetical protein
VAAWLGQEPLSVSFAFGAAGLARTATLTVRNLAGQACQGLFALRVLVATDEEGTQGAQTLAVTHGAGERGGERGAGRVDRPGRTAAIGITLGGSDSHAGDGGRNRSEAEKSRSRKEDLACRLLQSVG